MGTLFTWALTALGAAAVFLHRDLNQKMMDVMLGFAAGVMIAASFWSLLAPSIKMSEGGALPSWFPPAVGFLLGGFFMSRIDRMLPHLHLFLPGEAAEGPKTTWRRSSLLFLAVTLHNIPEGLAVGVAFGAVAAGYPEATLGGAMALTLGIGIQNVPEGMAVAAPFRRAGMSRIKSFWYGQFSGLVEVAGGVIGAAVILIALPILPYALAFAAGAMIFVVAEEVIPESHANGNEDQASIGLMVGFTVMMILDVGLGY